jgi:hypothetical protein
MDKTRQQAFDELLKRATAFEEMARTEGWEYVKAYYQNLIKAFINDLLTKDEPVASYENHRQELKGLAKLFGLIDSDLQQLEKYRNEQKATRSATK